MIILEDRLRIPPDTTDFDSFQRWAAADDFPEAGRIDFLAGDVEVDVSPEDLFTHNVVKSKIGLTLEGLLAGRAYVFGDKARVYSRFARLSVEPDVVVVLHDSVRAGKVRFAPSAAKGPDRYWAIEGAPDLVVEVVSDTSEEKDTRRLPPLYARAGVPEMWTVDARDEELSFRISTLQDGKLVPVPPDVEGWTKSPLLGRAFRLLRFRTELSTWDYVLESREGSSTALEPSGPLT
jgi:Uma2 family endonuclease